MREWPPEKPGEAAQRVSGGLLQARGSGRRSLSSGIFGIIAELRPGRGRGARSLPGAAFSPPHPALAVGLLGHAGPARSGRLWLLHRAPRGPEVRCFPRDSRVGKTAGEAVPSAEARAPPLS